MLGGMNRHAVSDAFISDDSAEISPSLFTRRNPEFGGGAYSE